MLTTCNTQLGHNRSAAAAHTLLKAIASWSCGGSGAMYANPSRKGNRPAVANHAECLYFVGRHRSTAPGYSAWPAIVPDAIHPPDHDIWRPMRRQKRFCLPQQNRGAQTRGAGKDHRWVWQLHKAQHDLLSRDYHYEAGRADWVRDRIMNHLILKLIVRS